MFQTEKFCYKVCPKCFEEDKLKYREAYLHRNHNYVGAKTCHKHHCYLDTIHYVVNRKGRYYDVDSEYLPGKILYPSDEVIELHNNLNKDIIFLLDGNMSTISPDIIRKKINTKVRLLGAYNRPFLNNDFLLREFHLKYPEVFLNEYDLGMDFGNIDTWLRKCLYSDKVEDNIFRQIISINFLFGSLSNLLDFTEEFEPFGKGPYPCMNKVCTAYDKGVI